MKTIFLWPLISFHSCFEWIHELIHGSGWDFSFFFPQKSESSSQVSNHGLIAVVMKWSSLIIYISSHIHFQDAAKVTVKKRTKLAAQ